MGFVSKVHYWVAIAAVVRNVWPYSSMLTRTFARLWELYKQRFPWPDHATDKRQRPLHIQPWLKRVFLHAC